VFVLGISYGSYWAQRYLQAFPAQADGVILEGVLPLGEALWESDPLADEAARSVFTACRAEPDCAAAFAPEDPEDVAARVVLEAEDPVNRCFGADGVDRPLLEQALSLLTVGNLGYVIPGLLRRLDRCSAEDQVELQVLADVLAPVFESVAEVDSAYDNQALGMHVLRTDIMAAVSEFPLEELLAAREPLIVWSGAAPIEEFAAFTEGWPVNYAPGPTAFPELATPILMLNGGLDIQTPSPWARKLASELDATLVEFPYVGHGVEMSLDSGNITADVDCALGILGAFTDEPGAPLDSSCAATAYTPDVAGHEPLSEYVAQALFGSDALLGTDAVGESAPTKAGAASAPKRPVSSRRELSDGMRESLVRAARRLRR
jgi:pimeloyl-ACP methyl ester carboxylesterase